MSWAPAEAREIFTVAVEQYSPEQWSSYLDQACGDNLELRTRVELLLEAHVGQESVLDSPAIAPPPSIVQPIPEKPGTHIGPYKLLQQIGEGGRGVIYMAEQHQPVRPKVAVKIMKPGMDTRQVIARFEVTRSPFPCSGAPGR